MNAITADTLAIGMAKRLTHWMPHRLIDVKNSTSATAITLTGTPGKYQ